jgi:hypothetical protein
MRNRVLPLVVVVLTAYAAGCSFSESSKSSSKSSGSISDIISSPFTSSSGSSSPESAYREEVKDFTASFVKGGGDGAKLRQEVGQIAEKRGISDWENNEATYVGIGKGLHKAGLNQAQLDGYKAAIGETQQQKDWIQDGYEQRK